MRESFTLLDPTAEREAVKRTRRVPPASLDGCTVALLNIGKARGDVFLDQLGVRFAERGISFRHYAKPTNTKTAPKDVIDRMVKEADVIVEALSD